MSIEIIPDKYVRITFPGSNWSLRISTSGNKAHIGLHQDDKETPTCETIVNAQIDFKVALGG